MSEGLRGSRRRAPYFDIDIGRCFRSRRTPRRDDDAMRSTRDGHGRCAPSAKIPQAARHADGAIYLLVKERRDEMRRNMSASRAAFSRVAR